MSSGNNNCKRVHQIEVEPLQQNETQLDKVEHSLLLIKGRVQPNCTSAKQLKATLKRRERQEEQQEQLTQLANTGEFKLLLDLRGEEEEEKEEQQEQWVELQLSCCNSERSIQFIYQPRSSVYRVQPLYLLCRSEQQAATEAEEKAEQQVEGKAEKQAETEAAVLAEKQRLAKAETEAAQQTAAAQQAAAEQQFLHSRCALIDLNLRLVQCIYAHKLQAAGFKNRTFTLNGNCSIFHSQLTEKAARASSEDELWQYFASEILASATWGQQLHLKFVAFIGCTQYEAATVLATGDYSYANIRKGLKAHAALGGGGLALFGSAHFYAWPQKFTQILEHIGSKRRVDLTRLPDESNYRRTYGGVYASTLGAVCHELGHCFDLGHTQEGVMGHGFDYLNRVLTVDQPTEHLPQRIVAAKDSSQYPSVPSRCTPLKLQHSAGSKLLHNYHSQRRNDCFYFTHNCAVILAQHRWLRGDLKALGDSPLPDIQLLPDSSEIVSSAPLRLIELRCNRNSLVAHYEEFAEHSGVHRFRLPDSLWHLLATERTHYAFVLTVEGHTKRLACDANKS